MGGMIQRRQQRSQSGSRKGRKGRHVGTGPLNFLCALGVLGARPLVSERKHRFTGLDQHVAAARLQIEQRTAALILAGQFAAPFAADGGREI